MAFNLVNGQTTNIVEDGEDISVEVKDDINKINIITGQEVATNEFIDGKQVYRKRINFGVLPNSTAKNVAHGIINGKIERVEGRADSTAGGNSFPLPYISVSALANCVALYWGATNITIETGTDRSSMSAIIDLYYTKI